MSLIRQEFDVLDYFGPLVVFAMFFLIVFTISFTCIMWFCITDVEKVEAVQKWKACRPPAMCVRLMAKAVDRDKVKAMDGKKGEERDGGGRLEMKDQSEQTEQIGLTKEQLQQYANDPYWVRLRMALMILFWLIWIIMFVAAVVIVVMSPKCPSKPHKEWWQQKLCYHVYTPAFYDSDVNGIGDINGVKAKLSDLSQLGVQTIRPVAIMQKGEDGLLDVTSHTDIDSAVGTLDDFDGLVNAAHQRGMYVIIDLPLITSTEHEWFVKYEMGEQPYANFYSFATIPDPTSVKASYVENPGKKPYVRSSQKNGTAYLNWSDAKVQEEMEKVVSFWISHDVDGFFLTGVGELQVLDSSGLAPFMAKLRHACGDTCTKNIAFFGSVGIQSNALLTRQALVGSGKLNAVSLDTFSNLRPNCEPKCLYDMVRKDMEELNSHNGSFLFWQMSSLDFDRLPTRMESNQHALAMVTFYMMLPGAISFVYGEELGLHGQAIELMCWNANANGGFSSSSEIARFSKAANCPTNSRANQLGQPNSYLSVFSRLGKLRSKTDAFLYGKFEIRLTRSRCMILVRESVTGSVSVVAVINLNTRPCNASYASDMNLLDASKVTVLSVTGGLHNKMKLRQEIDTEKEKDLTLNPYEGVVFQYERH